MVGSLNMKTPAQEMVHLCVFHGARYFSTMSQAVFRKVMINRESGGIRGCLRTNVEDLIKNPHSYCNGHNCVMTIQLCQSRLEVAVTGVRFEVIEQKQKQS